MKKLLILCSILILSSLCFAQPGYTAVSATITDPSGQLWINGAYAVDYQRPSNNQGTVPTILGATFAEHGLGGNISAFGSFSIALPDTLQILPTGGQWVFTICPNASSQCYVIPSGTNVHGATANLSIFLSSNINNPAVTTVNIPRAYKDSEVTPVKGGFYYDVTLDCLKFSNGATFTCVGTGGGGSGVPPGIPGQQVVYFGPSNPSTTVGGQNKPIYDIRDYNIVCDGVTDVTTPIQTLLATIGSNSAVIRIIGSPVATSACVIQSLGFPANITLDFSGGGALSLVTTITPPGGALLDGTPVGSFNANTSSCSVTINVPTSGDVIFLGQTTKFATGGGVGIPTDNRGNVYRLVSTSKDSNHYQSNTQGWIAGNVPSGSTTITIPYLAATNNMCGAAMFKGLGLSVGQDGNGAFSDDLASTGTPMSTVLSATFTTGSLLLAWGGQGTNTETCTAGAGFTVALSIGTNMGFCMEYQLSAAGGSVTATAPINNTPTTNYWMFNSIGLKPIYPLISVLGNIINPDLHKIFINASGNGQGSIDFLGNTILQGVYPEWWGASNGATPTVNTTALQAAEHGAFGTNRTNPSGLAVYNKPLILTTNYRINGELQFYDVSNFKVVCASRLFSGITQTASNLRIIDAQAMSYGAFYDCSWASSVSNTAPLIDIDYDGHTTPIDLAPQFIDFYNNTFIGNGVTDVGVLIAKSGGAAQGSNIYCHDCESIGFTGAAWQIGGNGTGRNVGRSYAQNALDIGYDGDIQGDTLYGIAVYGGGYVGFGSANRMSSMENGFFTIGSNSSAIDMYCEATQGPCVMEHVRSESRRLIAGSNIRVKDTKLAEQSGVPTPGGASGNAGQIYTGQPVTGDGAYYQETVSGTFGGVATFTSPNHTTSGTLTSLTDASQVIAGAVIIGQFQGSSVGELMTQATSGATGSRLNTPSSTGTITGSVTSGTIGLGHTMTQATTGVICTSTNAPITTTPLTCVNFSGIADNTHIWTDGTTAGTYTPSAAPTFSTASLVITPATGVPDNSHDWVGGTSLAHFKPTAVPVNEANFTVNAFTGMLIGLVGGTSGNCMATITSNTATVINFTGGFTTQYSGTICVAPDQSTTYYVEPKWNHGVIVDGTATLTYLDEDVIGTCNGCVGFIGRLEDVVVPGGRINLWDGSQDSTLSHVVTTRSDWLRQGQVSQAAEERDWDVFVTLKGANNNSPIMWKQPTIGGGIAFNGSLHRDLGGVSLCWNTGLVGAAGPPPANTSANEICAGGRSDAGANTTVFRNRFEVPGGIIGGIGPAVPTGIDQAGSDLNLMGGGSTGAGIPASIQFLIGTTSGSSGTPNNGTARWRIDGATGHLFASTDNTNDIGAAGATRPRNLYLAGSVNASSGIFSGPPTITTGTASNTDLAGELSFSAATTSSSYTFVGAYVSHPECTIGPLFDFGAHRIWISTLSTTTLQLSSDSAQTGAVSYICIGRN